VATPLHSGTNFPYEPENEGPARGKAHKSQVCLAICLHDGMHGFSTNRVQAYKWAAVAASQGHYKAKHLVEEWQASLSPKDVAAGKAAAAFVPRDKRKQD
jgi:hypothetical protein